jgi:hypothetical protein
MSALPAVQSVKADTGDASNRDDILLERAEDAATFGPAEAGESKEIGQREETPNISLSRVRSVALVATVTGATFLNVGLLIRLQHLYR